MPIPPIHADALARRSPCGMLFCEMTLAWRPVEETTLQTMVWLARSRWGREDLDRTCAAAGLYPAGESPPARQVFEEMGYVLRTAVDQPVSVVMNLDPDTITGFGIAFATFCEPDTEDDGDAVELLEDAIRSGQRVEPAAVRERFEVVWLLAARAVSERLGRPAAATGTVEEWQHAVWRYGDRLIAVAQGEDFQSMGLFEAAYIWILEYSADRALPALGDLARLWGGGNGDDAA